MTTRTLVAGIGNIFLGDDGFGVEVARRLASVPLPDHVDVMDAGIRGIHLAYELAGGKYHTAILVDITPRGGEPGTLYVIDPEMESIERGDAEGLNAHSLSPAAVLSYVKTLGEPPARILVVGCEPAVVDESMDLSAEVAGVVDEAVEMVRRLVGEAVAAQSVESSREVN